MKSKLSLAVISFLGATSLHAQTIELKPGWNLIGTGNKKIDIKNTFGNNSSIKYVWAFNNDDKKWLVYGNTQEEKNKINNSSYASNQVHYLDTYKGLWVLNDAPYKQNISLIETSNIPQEMDLSLSVSGPNGQIDTQTSVSSNVYIPTGLNTPVTLTYFKNGTEYSKKVVNYTGDNYYFDASVFSSFGINTLSVEISDGVVTYTDSISFKVEHFVPEPPAKKFILNYDFIPLSLSDVANRSFVNDELHWELYTFDSNGYAKTHEDRYNSTYAYQYSDGSIMSIFTSNSSSEKDTYQTEYKALAKNANGIILANAEKEQNQPYRLHNILLSNSAVKNDFVPNLPATLYNNTLKYTLEANGSVSTEDIYYGYDYSFDEGYYSNGVITIKKNFSSSYDDSGQSSTSTYEPLYKIGDFWVVENNYEHISWTTESSYEDTALDFATYNTWEKYFAATNSTFWGMKLQDGKVYHKDYNNETSSEEEYLLDENSSYKIINKPNSSVLDICYEEGTYCQKYEIKDGKMYDNYVGSHFSVFSENPVYKKND